MSAGLMMRVKALLAGFTDLDKQSTTFEYQKFKIFSKLGVLLLEESEDVETEMEVQSFCHEFVNTCMSSQIYYMVKFFEQFLNDTINSRDKKQTKNAGLLITAIYGWLFRGSEHVLLSSWWQDAHRALKGPNIGEDDVHLLILKDWEHSICNFLAGTLWNNLLSLGPLVLERLNFANQLKEMALMGFNYCASPVTSLQVPTDIFLLSCRCFLAKFSMHNGAMQFFSACWLNKVINCPNWPYDTFLCIFEGTFFDSNGDLCNALLKSILLQTAWFDEDAASRIFLCIVKPLINARPDTSDLSNFIQTVIFTKSKLQMTYLSRLFYFLATEIDGNTVYNLFLHLISVWQDKDGLKKYSETYLEYLSLLIVALWPFLSDPNSASSLVASGVQHHLDHINTNIRIQGMFVAELCFNLLDGSFKFDFDHSNASFQRLVEVYRYSYFLKNGTYPERYNDMDAKCGVPVERIDDLFDEDEYEPLKNQPKAPNFLEVSLEYLVSSDNAKLRLALQALPGQILRSSQPLIEMHFQTILNVCLNFEDSEQVADQKRIVLCMLIRRLPDASVNKLIDEFYGKNCSLYQRIFILSTFAAMTTKEMKLLSQTRQIASSSTRSADIDKLNTDEFFSTTIDVICSKIITILLNHPKKSYFYGRLSTTLREHLIQKKVYCLTCLILSSGMIYSAFIACLLHI